MGSLSGISAVRVQPFSSIRKIYYVDATLGNDANSGATPAAAWQTIAKVKGGTFYPGDRILFKRGETWTGTRLVVPASGSNGSPITFGAYGSGALPVLQGDAAGSFRIADKEYIAVQDLDASGINTGVDIAALQVHDSSHIILDGVIGRDAAHAGFFVEKDTGSVSDILIRDCLAYDNDQQGITIMGVASPGPTNCIMEECEVHDNGTDTSSHHGIYLKYVSDSVVRLNLSYDNAGAGIKVNDESTPQAVGVAVYRNVCYGNNDGLVLTADKLEAFNNILYGNVIGIEILSGFDNGAIYHNTVVNNSYVAMEFNDGYYPTNTPIKNNIFLQDPGANVCWQMASSADLAAALNGNSNNNTFYIDGNPATAIIGGRTLADWQGLAGGNDADSMHDNPDFVTDFTDLHLQVTSPCIAAGVNVGVADDYDGVARGDPPDIGAYEHVA